MEIMWKMILESEIGNAMAEDRTLCASKRGRFTKWRIKMKIKLAPWESKRGRAH
jgi:hypothetical protein